MTGYGKSVVEYDGKKIHVEIKSLNSKALDMSARIAPLYREKEIEIRQTVAASLERGKIDLNIWTEKDDTAVVSNINKDVAVEYFNQISDLSKTLGLNMNGEQNACEWMKVLLRMPDVMNRAETEELSDEEWNVVMGAVRSALENLNAFRIQEGEALAAKFTEKIENIRDYLACIEPYEKGRTEKIRQRIMDSLEQHIDGDYDKNRLEQEMIFYIEKLDISEEKQRLTNHLNYFLETMRDGKGQGKKLGFIAQEMGREINTTGSKSNQAEMQNIVVKMKDELEQIKEQVLNVL